MARRASGLVAAAVARAVTETALRDMAVALAYERLALRPRSAVDRAFPRRAEGIAR